MTKDGKHPERRSKQRNGYCANHRSYDNEVSAMRTTTSALEIYHLLYSTLHAEIKTKDENVDVSDAEDSEDDENAEGLMLSAEENSLKLRKDIHN